MNFAIHFADLSGRGPAYFSKRASAHFEK